MADMKGAVRMTIEYSDGSKTVVNYNSMSEEESKVEIAAEAEAEIAAEEAASEVVETSDVASEEKVSE